MHLFDENGDYAADCGTLVVPENRADPQSRLIALPVTRIRARSAHPAEPIFRLEGGPGVTNMEFAKASRFADDHDVVLSAIAALTAPSVSTARRSSPALKHSTDFLGEASFRRVRRRFRLRQPPHGRRRRPRRLRPAAAGRGPRGRPQGLGYDRIDLVSESAEDPHRDDLCLGASREHPPLGDDRRQPARALPLGRTDHRRADRPLRRALLAGRSCSTRTDDLVATMRQTARRHARALVLLADQGRERPCHLLLRAHGDHVRCGRWPSLGPITLDAWLAAADGDASGFWFQSLLPADLAFPESFVWGQMAAAARLDAGGDRLFSSGSLKPDSNLGDAATAFTWGGGRMADYWPAVADEDEDRTVRASNVETLLIGGELDFATPPQAATEAPPHLPNGRQVVLPDSGIRAPSGRSSRRQVPT